MGDRKVSPPPAERWPIGPRGGVRHHGSLVSCFVYTSPPGGPHFSSSKLGKGREKRMGGWDGMYAAYFSGGRNKVGEYEGNCRPPPCSRIGTCSARAAPSASGSSPPSPLSAGAGGARGVVPPGLPPLRLFARPCPPPLQLAPRPMTWRGKRCPLIQPIKS